MKVTRTTRLAAGAATTLALAACGSGSSGGSGGASTSAAAGSVKGATIGFSPYTLQAPALQGLAKGLQGIAAAQGLKVLVSDPKGDPVQQQQQLSGWVQRGQVKAIWLLPVAGPALKAVLTQAQAKGIVVLAAGVPQDYGFAGPQKGIAFSQSDYTQYGTGLAGLLTDCINRKLNGRATIISVRDPRPSTTNTQIAKAIDAGIAKGTPGAKVVNVDALDRLKAQQAVRSALQANPGATALVAASDEGTLGGLSAFEAAGKKPANLCVAGAGGGEEALAAVKSGKIAGEIAFDFQKDLGQNLATLTTMMQAPGTPGPQLTIPMLTVKAPA